VVDHVTAAKVFGAPISHDGITLVPVAKIRGGGGGGGGTGPLQEGHETGGTGGGMGLTARGVGVYVMKDGKVSWRPAIDVNRIILGGQVVAVVALLVIRSIANARSRARSGS